MIGRLVEREYVLQVSEDVIRDTASPASAKIEMLNA